MIAFDLDETFSEILSGSIPKVSSSISTNLGIEFTNKTEFAVETKENEGIKISSSLPKLYDNKVACNADVPEFSVTQ